MHKCDQKCSNQIDPKDESCNCGEVPNFQLSELTDLTDPLTLAEEGTSGTSKKQKEGVFRTIKHEEDDTSEGTV